MAEEKSDVVADNSHLPLSERVVHKQWKVREDAYKELAGKFNSAAEDSKIYVDFAPLLSRFVRDANAPAQLVGLEAVAKYADRAPPPLVRRVAGEVSKGIVEKGLTGRATNKQRAVDCVLMFVGADAGDIVVEAIVATGFQHRTPKVVSSAIDTLRQALLTYGSGALPVKPMASGLTPLFTHSSEPVRKAAKALVVELHRWVGDAVRAVLKDAPDVAVKELDIAFAENTGQPKPQPEKLTRAMEERVREAPPGDADGGGDDPFAAEGAAEEEELDLGQEIDLLPLLPKMKINVEGEDEPVKDWFVAMESKKWRVRKDALSFAVDSIGDNRLIPGNYSEVVARLRKVFAKDANVNVVAQAARLVSALAEGLRKNFAPQAAKALTVDLLGRLKEKNKVALEPVAAALDSLHLRRCIHISELCEELSAAAENKVPKARAELHRFLDRCFKVGTAAADLKGAPLKKLGAALVAATEDSTPEVRDAAVAAIASLFVLVGERNISPYMEKLDKLRTEKVLAIVKELPDPKRIAPSTASGSAAVAKSDANVRSSSKGPSSRSALSRSPAGRSSSRRAGKPVPQPVKVYVSDDEGEVDTPEEEALAKAAARFEGFDPECWSAKSYKIRVSCVEVLLSALASEEAIVSADVSIILSLLSVRPGLADSNFMAMKTKLELLGLIAEKSRDPMPRKTLKRLLETVVDKLGDIKCAILASGIFLTIAEATSPRYFFEILAKGACETSNGRAKIGMAKFATSMVSGFGLPAVPLKSGIMLVSGLLEDPPPGLRSAALTLGAAFAVRAAPNEVRNGLEASGKVESSMLELFDAEVEKRSSTVDPPSRKRRFGPGMDSTRPSSAAEVHGKATSVSSVSQTVSGPGATPVGHGGVGQDVASASGRSPSKPLPSDRSARSGSSVPPSRNARRAQPVAQKVTSAKRTMGPSSEPPEIGSDSRGTGSRRSISEHFGSGSRIIADLKSSSWKSRQDALSKIDAIVKNAGSCISGNVGVELMPELRRRFGDSNRNVAALAYAVVGRLGSAMGPGAQAHVKIIMPPVLSNGCVDIKRSVRDAAASCLDQWVEAVGLTPLIPMLPAPLASLNSGFRKDYLEWLVPRLNGSVGSFSAADEDLSVLVDPCLACLRDRIAEVRQLAEAALGSIIASVGFGLVEGKVLNLTKSARLQLEPIIGKFRNDLPVTKAGPRAAGSPGSRVQSAQDGARSTSRERPRSLALPSPRGSIGTNRRAGLDGPEPSTPRGGLRRVRPQSARASSTKSMEDSGDVNAAGPVTLLHGGSGRGFRARHAVAAKSADSAPREIPSVLPSSRESWDSLCDDLRECVAEPLFQKLSAPSNRFQLHADAIDQIVVAMREDPDRLVECADVLLRWAVYRIDESRTPPTMLQKACEFISSICEVLLSSGSKIGDYEASAVVPVLVDKCGSNRAAVREALLAALLSVGDVLDDQKLMAYLVSGVWETQSVRSKLEICNALPHVIDRVFGAGKTPLDQVMTVVAKVAYGMDEPAGRAAAACIERVHQHVGDDVWAMVGEVTDDQAELLESRFPQVPISIGPGGGEEPPSPQSYGQDDPGTPSRRAAPVPAPPEFPQASVRTEDFRLSVAPAPPSNVMTAIGDSFGMDTPRRPGLDRADFSSVAGQTPALPSRRPRGGAGNFSFISSQKSSRAQTVMDLLSSDLRSDQEQGLVLLFDDLSEHRSSILYDCASEVLPLLSRGFRDCVERLEDGSADSREQHVLKQYLNALMAFVSAPSVIRAVDQGTIEQLLSDVVDAMIPDEMPKVDDWERVRRGVNLAVLKILETCNRNLLFTALFNLLLVELRMGVDPGDKPLAKSQLLAKSIAKVTRRGFADITVEALLRDMNLFITSLTPSQNLADCITGEDEAGSVVRSVVDPLMDEIGQSIYSKLSLIPSPNASPLVHYISKVLPPETESPRKPLQDSHKVGHPRADVLVEPSETDPHEKLTGIFDHLLSSGGQDAGLRRLRAFTVCYPDVDIEPHLSKCSVHFQRFIRNGLERISTEPAEVEVKHSGDSRHSTPKSSALSSAGSAVDSALSGSPGLESSGQAYLKRLREIQIKYGLPELRREDNMSISSNVHALSGAGTIGTDAHGSSSAAVGAATAPFRAVEKENGTADAIPAPETRDKAAALRERMARIREASAEH